MYNRPGVLAIDSSYRFAKRGLKTEAKVETSLTTGSASISHGAIIMQCSEWMVSSNSCTFRPGAFCGVWHSLQSKNTLLGSPYGIQTKTILIPLRCSGSWSPGREMTGAHYSFFNPMDMEPTNRGGGGLPKGGSAKTEV